MSTIVDFVVADKNLSTMLQGLKASGIENELNKPGPFTVFAPIEIAFGKLPKGDFIDLLTQENKTRLIAIINNHVVEGKINFKDFTDGQQLNTIGGKKLNVKVFNRSVSINGSPILSRDNEASNGVVHSVGSLIAMD